MPKKWREKKRKDYYPERSRATCSFFREHPSNAIVIFLSTLDDQEKTEKGRVRARGANEWAEPSGKLASRSCDLTDTRDQYTERFFSSLFFYLFFHSQRNASVLGHNTIGRRLGYELTMRRGLSSILRATFFVRFNFNSSRCCWLMSWFERLVREYKNVDDLFIHCTYMYKIPMGKELHLCWSRKIEYAHKREFMNR